MPAFLSSVCVDSFRQNYSMVSERIGFLKKSLNDYDKKISEQTKSDLPKFSTKILENYAKSRETTKNDWFLFETALT